jgi:hypothetical protein
MLEARNQTMRVEDALRKIRLLRRVIPENGASEFEAETATRLVQALMERYSIGLEAVHAVASPRNRMTWVYWEQLLAEFGIALDRFGGRASVSLGSAQIVIRLATGHWHVQQVSSEGWKTAVRDSGLESLRAYLAKYVPRSYSLAGQK